MPGIFAGTADDTIERCAPESLEAVGLVTLEALGTIGSRLAKIDRFARSPVSEVEALERQSGDAAAQEAPAEVPAGSPEAASPAGPVAGDGGDAAEPTP